MTKHKSQDYKLSAVKYYLKSKNASETCRIFECSSRSLMRWVKKYEISINRLELMLLTKFNKTNQIYKIYNQ